MILGVDYLKSDGSLTRRWRLSEIMPIQFGWHPFHPGFYALRRLLLDLNGFNQIYKIASDLMLRAFEKVSNKNIVVHSDKAVNMYLGGASNASIANILKGKK